MPTFTYQAKQGPTNVVQGTLQAKSQEEAVARLLQEGLVPVSILIRAEDLPGAAAGPRRGRGRAKDQCPMGGLRLLLEDLERHMRDGNSLSDALARHPKAFPPLFISAIRAGE